MFDPLNVRNYVAQHLVSVVFEVEVQEKTGQSQLRLFQDVYDVEALYMMKKQQLAK